MNLKYKLIQSNKIKLMENFHSIRSQNFKQSINQTDNPITKTNISLIKELMENNEKDLIISNQKTYIY